MLPVCSDTGRFLRRKRRKPFLRFLDISLRCFSRSPDLRRRGSRPVYTPALRRQSRFRCLGCFLVTFLKPIAFITHSAAVFSSSSFGTNMDTFHRLLKEIRKINQPICTQHIIQYNMVMYEVNTPCISPICTLILYCHYKYAIRHY